MGVSLISVTENFEKVIATAARVCYSGLPIDKLLTKYSEEENRDLVRRVVGMGHLSVVEHAVFTFKVSPDLKEELFEIMIDKPFLKISQREDCFIVSLNLRTMIELSQEKPSFQFVREVSEYIPEFLRQTG